MFISGIYGKSWKQMTATQNTLKPFGELGIDLTPIQPNEKANYNFVDDFPLVDFNFFGIGPVFLLWSRGSSRGKTKP